MKMLARFFADSTINRKPIRPRAFIAIIVVVALFAVLASTVAAQEEPGALFTGIGFIDDHSVEDGTIVEAWIRGIPVAATEIVDQGFILHVLEPPGESFDGEAVRFTFHGLETDAVARWVEGAETYINLYAHTGLQDDGGNGTADPEPGEIAAIRELQARLSELLREQLELGAAFEEHSRIDIVKVTNRWRRAIEELQAEVELRIRQAHRQIEFERQQIAPGPRRDAMLTRLDAELDESIQRLWVEFEFDVQLKERHRDDEILEMSQARGFDLINLNQLISQVEAELSQRLEMAGLSRFEIMVDLVGNESPGGPLDGDRDDPSPKTSDPEEGERNRGFFTNSISADASGLNNSLDPTALALIGILITMVATGAQLLKGN